MKRFSRLRKHLPPLALPVIVIIVGIIPHLSKLGDHIVASHKYWYDGLIHTYLSWEKFKALTFQQGFFDFKWFYPYPDTGTYNEPAVTNGVIFGLLDIVTPGEVWAFNLTMVLILLLNAVALYFLLFDIIHRRWIATIFATVGALSPFAWVRYFHPANTTLFWGLLGLLFLRRAIRKPTWGRCTAIPIMFVVQLYSSLYAGMYFVVPLILLLPFSLIEAYARKTFLKFVFRAGVATLALLPLLAVLQMSYLDTRRELGKENTYEYVSEWMRKGTDDLAPSAPLTCQLKIFGFSEAQKKCRDELFPGRLVSAGAMLGILVAGIVLVWRVARRRFSLFALGSIVLPAAGIFTAYTLKSTLPFHIGLWLALALPAWRPLRMLAVRDRGAVYFAAAMLVLDVALNPVISVFGTDIESIHRYFFIYIPGFDGLRSEYRIIVLLPVFLSVVAAISTRRFLSFMGRIGWRRRIIAITIFLSLWAVFDGQPAWQEYRPAPRSDRKTEVLAAVSELPDDAIIAFLRGRGNSLIRYLEHDGAYWVNYVVVHGHRQITSKSTYKAPASEAIGPKVARLKDRNIRLKWAQRLAYMFGATHIVIDWSDQQAPELPQIELMLQDAPGAKVLVRDEHMALIEIGEPLQTAHGPVANREISGEPLDVHLRMRADHETVLKEYAVDDDPTTFWNGRRPQRLGDWVEFEMDQTHCLSGIAISPGLAIERHPTTYSVEALTNDGWKIVVEQKRWEVPQSLITKPGTGLIAIPFDEPVKAEMIRITLSSASPWPWIIANFKVYGSGQCN
ncbi:MAG: hypothetical protein GY854_21905 [Deltaproteobacteria bacterium]|nr:hypothetical protein [Deltaproteobacteria bacterium]